MAIKNTNSKRPSANVLWHTRPSEWIIKELSTSREKGLCSEDAAKKLEILGRNELEQKKGHSPFRIFISQFNDFLIWVLLAAAIISGIIIREITDAVFILVILIINAVLGFIQEYRAEQALQALKKLASPTTKAIRDGKEIKIDSSLLVPGDLIKLSAGDLVPADCRIIEVANLQTNEAPITGESLPVEKTTESFDNPHLALGDRKNLVYSGTTVTRGRCLAVVVATGKNTEIGKIASMVQETEQVTPLQRELKTIGQKIGIICIITSAIVFGTGLIKGNPVAQMLLVAIALAVAAIPEGLPAIVTVSLSLGVQKMAKNNAIIRRLSSVESLGEVTVICTDKTGTLTMNKMMVQKIFMGLEESKKYSDYINDRKENNIYAQKMELLDKGSLLGLILESALLCNDAYIAGSQKHAMVGDPTETALLELGASFNIDKKELELNKPRKMEEPFDSKRKMMTTIHQNHGGKAYTLYSKGAPEVIIEKCSHMLKDNKIVEITRRDMDRIHKNNAALAENGMRNLAFAFKSLDRLPHKGGIPKIENNLVYLGMVGMIDPPRPEAYEAIRQCKKSNIEVIMITGDHKLTAKSIGKELGILQKGDQAIDGEEFDSLNSKELRERIKDIKIFARLSPSNKVDIVAALKANRHIVAMTGDGINDAPSLKKADIGVSMGITGTDVSKESSDMILADDNFATIVKAVKLGRAIYDNLNKFLMYLLSCNTSSVLLVFITIVMGDYIFYLLFGGGGFIYIPLLPVQILWMNLITNGLPAMALGVDIPEPKIMDRKATKDKEQMLSRRRLGVIGWQGLILSLGALFVYFGAPVIFSHLSGNAIDIFRTIVFTTLVLSQLLHTFNYRFKRKGIFRKGIWANKYLNLVIFVSIILQVIIIYTPDLQKIFSTAALGLNHWGLIAACSIVPVIFINFINEIRYKIPVKERD